MTVLVPLIVLTAVVAATQPLDGARGGKVADPNRAKPNFCQAQKLALPKTLLKKNGEKLLDKISTPRGTAEVMATVRGGEVHNLYAVVRGKKIDPKPMPMPAEVAACAESKDILASEASPSLLGRVFDALVPDAEAVACFRTVKPRSYWEATVCYGGAWCRTCLGYGRSTCGCYDW